VDIFLKPKNYQTLAHNKLDCLSWYIKDVSFVLAHHLTKLPLPTNDKKAKDRGKHVIYEEMIQTWVTYEVVKVLYLYGLNPSPRTRLDKIAPEIEKYSLYSEYNEIDDEDDKEDMKDIHELLFKRTQHSGTFEKCTFASLTKVKWKEDVKFMIPFLLLTWLRHLQQYFNNNKNQSCTWTKVGNYQPHVSLSKGESKNPLSIVYLPKPSTNQPVKVKDYNDIKPDEPQKFNKDMSNVLFASFEEWAMLLLTPTIQKRFTQAIQADDDTRRRWNMCEKKINHHYKFRFNEDDYANKDKSNKNKKTQLQPTLDYSDKTNEEIHADINKGLINGLKAIDKIKAKKREQLTTTR